jgi:hypothetical protein
MSEPGGKRAAKILLITKPFIAISVIVAANSLYGSDFRLASYLKDKNNAVAEDGLLPFNNPETSAFAADVWGHISTSQTSGRAGGM